MEAKVLIIGSGGREHALACAIQSSPKVKDIYVSPGNGGSLGLMKAVNVTLENHDLVVGFCQDHAIDLVVIGPEVPLVAGLADRLRAGGVTVFGPSQAAAQLEGSKSFATEFMQRHDIPLPPSSIGRDTTAALAAIKTYGGPEKSVIKADGLAGGKGVILPDTEAEASQALTDIFAGSIDHDGSRVVVQQRYHGPEVSVFVLSDGKDYRIIPLASQDHKRLRAGDTGPNTGGMGVYAPLPDWMLSKDQWDKIAGIAKKTIEGMKAEGIPYEGVLYLGLMLAEELAGDPIVIEYNVRFGDPETEVIMPLLVRNNVDVFDLLYATANGTLAGAPLPTMLKGAALTICLAAAFYPDAPQVDQPISGLDKVYRYVDVFHGSTKTVNGVTTSAGGRVLFVTGVHDTLEDASAAATAAIGPDNISFPGMQYRSDIGYRAFKR